MRRGITAVQVGIGGPAGFLTCGDAERAIDWGGRAIRLSPLDPLNYIPHGVMGFALFLLGRHEEAVALYRQAIQVNPGFSLLHGWLAAPLAKLGRIEEAKAAGSRLLALNPGFSSSRWCAAVGVAPHITGPVIDALRQAGLPEQAADGFTSMGRLTLNVMLSFAQFEREVAGERIRDKFAASDTR
jgi:tetratricopeptide (TPR) repeat protein